jgi:hypothetical protein
MATLTDEHARVPELFAAARPRVQAVLHALGMGRHSQLGAASAVRQLDSQKDAWNCVVDALLPSSARCPS